MWKEGHHKKDWKQRQADIERPDKEKEDEYGKLAKGRRDSNLNDESYDELGF